MLEVDGFFRQVFAKEDFSDLSCIKSCVVNPEVIQPSLEVSVVIWSPASELQGLASTGIDLRSGPVCFPDTIKINLDVGSRVYVGNM